MLPLHTAVFFSPDAPSGQAAPAAPPVSPLGGEDPFGGPDDGGAAALAALQGGAAAGEDAMGGDQDGSDADGEHPFGQPDEAPKPDPKPKAKADPKPQEPKPESKQESGPVLSDDHRADLEAVYPKATIEKVFKDRGQAGIDVLVSMAQEKLLGASLDDPEPEGQGAENATDGRAAEPPAKKEPAAAPQDVAVPEALKLDPETESVLRDQIGDAGYEKFVSPLVQHVNAQQAVISAQKTEIKKVIAYAERIVGHFNKLREDQILDGLASPLLGNSLDELSKEQVKMRGVVLAKAKTYLTTNKGSSVAQALKFAVRAASNKSEKQEGADSVLQQVRQRGRQVDPVPRNPSGGSARPSGPAPKSLATAEQVLRQGLAKLG